MSLKHLEDLEMELWLRKRNNGELKHTTPSGDKIALKNMSEAAIIEAIEAIHSRRY